MLIESWFDNIYFTFSQDISHKGKDKEKGKSPNLVSDGVVMLFGLLHLLFDKINISAYFTLNII